MKSLGIRDTVLFLGRVPFKNLPALLSQATIFALPSLREGMPYSLLEAMACGKPIVGTNVVGIRDLIKDSKNGLLVPPRNEKELANALLTLLTDRKLRSTFSRNARREALNHSWENISGKIEMLYQDVLLENA